MLHELIGKLYCRFPGRQQRPCSCVTWEQPNSFQPFGLGKTIILKESQGLLNFSFRIFWGGKFLGYYSKSFGGICDRSFGGICVCYMICVSMKYVFKHIQLAGGGARARVCVFSSVCVCVCVCVCDLRLQYLAYLRLQWQEAKPRTSFRSKFDSCPILFR